MRTQSGAGCSLKDFMRYVLPSVAAMLLFSLYTVVDAIFVAWGAGEEALTAVNIALPFVNCLSGFAVLISMGTATLVAFARGREDTEEADGLFSQTVFVIVAVSLVVTLLAAIFAEPLALFLGAGPMTLADTTGYLRVVSLFSLCFILSYCLEIMVKVDGRPYMAVVGVGTSFVTNIVLDYLFIMVFHWGVMGAALATGLAQLLSLIIFLLYFFSKKAKLRIRSFKPRPRELLRIFPLGVADCSVELIVAFLTFLYNHILLLVFGEWSLTVFAVVAYLNLFVFMVMQGIAQGMMHLVSFHIGRGSETVAKGYFRMSIVAALGMGVLFTALCQLAPDRIAMLLLQPDSPVFAETIRAVRQFSLSFLVVGLNIAIAGYLTARENPKPSIFLAVGRGFLFAPLALLPCAFLWGGQLIWLAALFGEVMCLAVSLYVLRRVTGKSEKTQSESPVADN